MKAKFIYWDSVEKRMRLRFGKKVFDLNYNEVVLSIDAVKDHFIHIDKDVVERSILNGKVCVDQPINSYCEHNAKNIKILDKKATAYLSLTYVYPK